MITKETFEKEIDRSVFNETAAERCFELAKQMAKEQNAELLQALDKCVRYFEMHRNGGCNGEGRKPEAGSSYEVAKNLLAEYSGTPASSLAQEAEGKDTLMRLATEHFKWTSETFPEATAQSSLLKLQEEIAEIEHDLRHENSDTLAIEYADAFMCLIDSAGRAKIDVEKLTSALAFKLGVNKSRKWVKNPDNTYSHEKLPSPPSSNKIN